VLPRVKLAKLHFSSNGIALSYELSYKEQGSKTLYITFIRRFATHAGATKTMSFHEDGSVIVFDGKYDFAAERVR
jgi:hypothetical protein